MKSKQFARTLWRYGRIVNTHDLIKAFAMILVFFDHSGFYIFTHHHNKIWLRLIGRGAAPLFFFIVGTNKSYRFNQDILWYGLILTLTTYLTESMFYFNILINFVLIKLVLDYIKPTQLSNAELILIFVLCTVILLFTKQWLEYSTSGLLFAFSGNLLREKNERAVNWLTASIISYFVFQNLVFGFYRKGIYEYTFIAICILLWMIMYFYKLREWKLMPIAKYPILFLSRYSLQIYFWHLIILQLYYFNRTKGFF